MEDITAYHHTNEAAALNILAHGFDSKVFKKVSLGFGVQCFLYKQKYPPYEGKTDGQIEVFFKNCNVLRNKKLIEESRSLIRDGIDDNERLKIAKEEAERIKQLGYDAYIAEAAAGREAIVFLNFPQPIKWIPYIE